MNEPSITPTPWKNHTTPTTISTIAIARRIHDAPVHDTTSARDAMIAERRVSTSGMLVVVGEHVGPTAADRVEHVGRHLLGRDAAERVHAGLDHPGITTLTPTGAPSGRELAAQAVGDAEHRVLRRGVRARCRGWR